MTDKKEWKTLSVRPDVWNDIKNDMGNTESYNEWCERALKSIERAEELEKRVKDLKKNIAKLEGKYGD